MVSVQIFLFFYFLFFLFCSLIKFLFLHVVKLTTRGQGSLSSVIQFAFFVLFLILISGVETAFFVRLIWRTVSGAHHGETNVDQEEGVFCFYFIFILFVSPLLHDRRGDEEVIIHSCCRRSFFRRQIAPRKRITGGSGTLSFFFFKKKQNYSK